ncbi:MAG TPA: hypothetical protein VK879_03610, partial [Candidatus Sulfomarinibacteraceae bacterium]|nr:hypothetical protein [Candidatus Sulfomarinibacteraceae bacterium]
MAQDDEFLAKAAKTALLSGTEADLETILYRQDILKDCLKHPSVVRQLFDLALEAIENEKKTYYGLYSRSPSLMLNRSREVLDIFVGILKRVRKVADQHAMQFDSEGFMRLFAMVHNELDDDYFATIERHLDMLRFRPGVLISAQLGKGNKGVNYVLRKPHDTNPGLLARIFGDGKPSYTFRIADRDDAGARALSELRDKGLHLVANALAQATDHILSFFIMLRNELAFYIGCLNLHRELSQLGEPLTFPVPQPCQKHKHTFTELYDATLALTMKKKVVGNDLEGDDKDLVVITGANQGGKSTFLRSIGLSQLMMQCGMFVPAESFRANLCDGLFTHYRREEDTTMESGKLDEELSRMSEIADHVTPHSLVLFNESFSATNDREGS